ncbi:MAG: terpene cyclase/mutase family protein [Candidatus Hydrogenedentes bacterium]|nr:terpene cyclase/mutase family protein [Candidatus Hydrogenedentota bacterium]
MARTLVFATLLAGLCISPPALNGKVSSNSGASAQTVQQTVTRATAYLRTESAAWLSSRTCAACHHIPMALWALSEADRRGYEVDKQFITDTTETALGSVEKLMAVGLQANPANPPDPRPMAAGVNIGAAFMAAVGSSLLPLEPGQRDTVTFIADDIVKKQRGDGSWEFFLSRSPVNESQTTDAVWIIMALQADNRPGALDSRRGAIEKASAWLANASPPDNLQDKALGLLLASRAGKSRAEMQTPIDEILALQLEDGGWGQKADMPSDAFATGEVLYVLSLAGYTPADAPIQRGIDFLVTTQAEDGSWLMTSRATPDGSPGSSKLLTPITCAGAAWATLGLASLVPNGP